MYVSTLVVWWSRQPCSVHKVQGSIPEIMEVFFKCFIRAYTGIYRHILAYTSIYLVYTSIYSVYHNISAYFHLLAYTKYILSYTQYIGYIRVLQFITVYGREIFHALSYGLVIFHALSYGRVFSEISAHPRYMHQ